MSLKLTNLRTARHILLNDYTTKIPRLCDVTKFFILFPWMFGDFNHSNLGNAQGLIYKKMLECRKTAEPKKPDSDTSHTPQYGFSGL